MATIEITAETQGADQVEMQLTDIGERATHLMPVMKTIFEDMMHVESSVFYAQGRRGGGSWKRLAQSTVKKKGFSTILIDMGDLLYSLTEDGATHQIKEITDESVMLGTTRPWAAVHQKGSRDGHVPRRVFMEWTRFDRDRWDTWISDYVVNPKEMGRRGRTHG